MLVPILATIALAQPPSTDAKTKPPPPVVPINDTVGPFLGHVGTVDARLWMRVAEPGEYALSLREAEASDATVPQVRATASSESDLCLHFDLRGLKPDTPYVAFVHSAHNEPPPGDRRTVEFRTRKAHTSPQSVTFAIGSCQHDDFVKPQPVWDEIGKLKPDAMLLIGDTPYIDSTKLDVQRRRYREFFSIPQLASLCRSIPTHGLWDDHDFGKGDTDGTVKGKENTRRAFLEYHANAPTGSGDGLGEHNLGGYSSMRIGPAEVWLIDCRWFAGTEPSFADPSKKSLLGAQQWSWLQRTLKASDAPFKLLVSGMVWCDEVRPNKPDYWGGYPHERTAVFDFLRESRIEGVVLLGGDIHRNRAYKHTAGGAFTGALGYPLFEVITSPLGSSIMKQGDASPLTQPEMLYDSEDLRTFAVVVCDSTKSPPTLVVRWMNDTGKELYRIETTTAELSFPSAPAMPSGQR